MNLPPAFDMHEKKKSQIRVEEAKVVLLKSFLDFPKRHPKINYLQFLGDGGKTHSLAKGEGFPCSKGA